MTAGFKIPTPGLDGHGVPVLSPVQAALAAVVLPEFAR